MFKKQLAILKKLNLPRNEFAIFGSGPMVVRGIREGNDIDIIVKPELWKKLIKKYPKKKENLIVVGEIEIYADWIPWFADINELVDNSDIIQGFRFVKLENVLKWKKEYNREKDQKDIQLIKGYLEKCKR